MKDKLEKIKFDPPELEEAYQRVLKSGIFDKFKKMKKIRPGQSIRI